MKISVVTASYNYAKYITNTIKSVLNQTHDDWEMIIVDDGSTDNSIEIIKSFIQKDSRIKLFTHENNQNKGLAETLKLGIEQARGEWIVFLESDDSIMPKYMEEKIKVIEKYKDVDFVFNDLTIFGNEFRVINYSKGYIKRIFSKIRNISYPAELFELFKNNTGDNFIPTFSTVMLRKEILDGIDYNSPVKPYLDWYIWLQLLKKGCKFYFLDKKLTNWRMHKKSYITSKISDNALFLFEFKKNLILKNYFKIFKLLYKKILFSPFDLFNNIRKKIIRIHFKDEEIVLFNKAKKAKWLKYVYSFKVIENRRIYRILGIKISKKNKLKLYKFNVNEAYREILKKISNDDVKIVSFDIFDTLLVRPCINPTDIFSLIAQKVDVMYNIDFLLMRQTAEKETGIKNPNIYDIYNFIKYKYNLSEELKQKLLWEEINIECRLLSSREDAKVFYKEAIENNKKIIAISDMYIPSDILFAILKKNGFEKISKIYVSCENDSRKDDGTLFDVVKEDCKTNKILHIGDNYISDYKMPLLKGIDACYYPRVIDILKRENMFLNNLIEKANENTPEVLSKNILLGFVLNNYWFKYNFLEKSDRLLKTISDFSNLFLAPYLCYISFLLQKNSFIQKNYEKIYFVARDGYLPSKIYDILNTGKYIKSEYLYASRIAYWTGTYSSIYDLLLKQRECLFSDYTLKDFLKAYICDKKTLSFLMAKLSDKELQLKPRDSIYQCIDVLKKEEKLFNQYYNFQKECAKKYYSNIFKNDKERIVVFDVGYSGSISLGISKLSGKIVDKIYVHETQKNIYRDNKYKTRTFVLNNGIDSNRFGNLDLLLEETFSPLEGTCIGFIKNEDDVVKPLIDNMVVSHEMKASMDEIRKTCEEFAVNLVKTFGEYFEYLNIVDINPLFILLNQIFKASPSEKEIFDSIIFNDTAVMHEQISLMKKIKA